MKENHNPMKVALAQICLVAGLFVPCASAAKSSSTSRHTATDLAAPKTGPTMTGATTQQTQSKIIPVVTVTEHLDRNRESLYANIGANTYRFGTDDIKALVLGSNASLQQLLAQAPGVNQDSFGQVHIRGNMANVQYRINGIFVPAELTGFGHALSPAFAKSISMLTGSLPAEYGFDTSAIVNITTRSGQQPTSGGISIMSGSHRTIKPKLDLSGTTGSLSWYMVGSYTHTDQGIDSPTPSAHPMHDTSHQSEGFTYLSYLLNSHQRLTLALGYAGRHYEIPDNPGQPAQYTYGGLSLTQLEQTYPSATLDETQRQTNRFELLALQGTEGALSYQISMFNRLSNVRYRPDPVGDLVYNGIAPHILRSNTDTGFQADLSDSLNDANTLRFGFIASHQHAISANDSMVFPAGADGTQIGDLPVSLTDNYDNSGWQYGLYVQDEWQPTQHFTLNYGVRADRMDYFGRYGQLSPRINADYSLGEATTLHAGFARYFTPPNIETIPLAEIQIFQNTTGSLPGSANTIPRPQRASYYDAGVDHDFGEDLHLGIDAYFERLTDVLDLGQFGQALIYSSFNYASGRINGVELTGNYNHAHLSVYGNLTYLNARARRVVTGQYNFDFAELAYIAGHYIPVDHAQKWTLAGGSAYQLGDNTSVSANMIFGSGYPTGFANQTTLPSYATLNLALTKGWPDLGVGNLSARLSIINLFDRVYEIRDGSGVGAGAPQYLQRRAIYLTLTDRTR